MNDIPHERFVETLEYLRFQDFCEACMRNSYVGLCYGLPGVGKTLSARRYSRWDKIEAYQRSLQVLHTAPPAKALKEIAGHNIILYTAQVVNSAGRVEREIGQLRQFLLSLIREDITRKKDVELNHLRREQEKARKEYLRVNWFGDGPKPKHDERIEKLTFVYSQAFLNAHDPTRLIIIDEADRLRMAALEQVRDTFDQGGIGLILIGMPGIEKRLARYPQLYSRVGFVHQFRPLAAKETRRLLQSSWRPLGISLPSDTFNDEEILAAILRITGGNFRLISRLLAQIAHVMEMNPQEKKVTAHIVEFAREGLVIGVE
jgi:DNA transposition AAA+ family ATPase